MRKSPKSPTVWNTTAGSFSTMAEAKVQFKLVEFKDNCTIEHKVHLANNLGRYDMIMGRDLLSELGFIIDFQNQTTKWDEVTIDMKNIDSTFETSYQMEDPVDVQQQTSRVQTILDAKYEAADLEEIVQKDCSHLSTTEQDKLLQLLRKYEDLFDGTLGQYKGGEYDIELKADATPYHARPFPVPKVHERTLKVEVERLCEIGVLKKVNRSEWASPTFIIPKKNNTVRFISDFRELNKRIKRKPFPLPKIQDLLLKLEGFKYGTSLDLNMGYYHIELTPNSKRLCTIVLPWGKYEYQRLPMGLCNSPDIFQEHMSTLFGDLEYIRTYLDDLLCLTKEDWDDHLEKVEEILKRLQKAGLKVNAKKSFFGRSKLEYLGYIVTRDSIQPTPKKVAAINAIQIPKTRKELRRFIGMINYYRDMWPKRSEILAPLTQLSSSAVPWKWTDEHTQAFNKIKKVIAVDTQLTYPDFNEEFVIHTDASHTQLGAVISQKGKPIAFYTRKLNPAQTRYTTTERELLSIVETLKEFRTILLGQKITVYTDHKNLTHKNFNTERVMRWRLILEEYGPELRYVKGAENPVADAMSRLHMETDTDKCRQKRT